VVLPLPVGTTTLHLPPPIRSDDVVAFVTVTRSRRRSTLPDAAVPPLPRCPWFEHRDTFHAICGVCYTSRCLPDHRPTTPHTPTRFHVMACVDLYPPMLFLPTRCAVRTAVYDPYVLTRLTCAVTFARTNVNIPAGLFDALLPLPPVMRFLPMNGP